MAVPIDPVRLAIPQRDVTRQHPLVIGRDITPAQQSHFLRTEKARPTRGALADRRREIGVPEVRPERESRKTRTDTTSRSGRVPSSGSVVEFARDWATPGRWLRSTRTRPPHESSLAACLPVSSSVRQAMMLLVGARRTRVRAGAARTADPATYRRQNRATYRSKSHHSDIRRDRPDGMPRLSRIRRRAHDPHKARGSRPVWACRPGHPVRCRSWTVRYRMALVGTPAVRGGIL